VSPLPTSVPPVATTFPMQTPARHPSPSGKWLIRISEVFSAFANEIVATLGGTISKKLGTEYLLIELPDSSALHLPENAGYLRWNLPLEHAWPCNPEKMEGFVEKAAQAIHRKFGSRAPQAIFVGQTDPSVTKRYYKALASNLRGRTLQLFPPAVAAFKEVEAQDPTRPSLFCLVGKEGLFCGLQSPRASKGFYPGGTKYISQGSPDTISRAGAKIAEALHFLLLHRPLPRTGGHWLELGASPGGMTSELLDRGYQVTAIDRAPLDPRLDGREGLHFAKLDVAAFLPNSRMKYDAIVSDMNGDPREAIRQVARLSNHLRPGGLVIFTLKTQGVTTFAETNELIRSALATAAAAGMAWITSTHLTYNRHELTLFFETPRSA
jgi:23S rRNA (cytidine2498-2'-O)-methyltransferase